MQLRIKTKLAVYITIALFASLALTQSSHHNSVFANTEQEKSTLNTDVLPKTSPINDSFLQRPILDIAKTVNATTVNPDEDVWIRVNVTLKNIGNATAYNLTSVDPDFGDWAISSLNVTQQKWVIVEVNATTYYFYYFKPLVEGNFTIEPTDIVYVDINGTEYHAQSQRFVILSIKPESLEVIDAELWLNILYYSIIIAGALGAIVLFDLFVLKRPKDVKKTKVKVVKKKATSTQQSKKQIKKKTKKRR
ncbi:MAG: hypothetical protein GOP50_00440 [Candidatus Heimdallarchaeota archaeon]|nr:hypothetical protein [Candidatus Heimdallarchaeota archaeon]